jgi:YbbR domain-containing protein
VRKRSETIGKLGRAPARTSTLPSRRSAKLPPPDHGDRGERGDRGSIRKWLRGALLENLGLKGLSMILAITVFLLVNTDRDREISARVGVSYTLPDDRVLVSERLDEVRVMIKGPWQRLRRFDEREIERINIDLRRASSGDVPLSADMIDLPSGLRVTSISPKSVRVLFDRRVEKIVEVNPQLAGRPMHGYYVAEVKPTPATIRVRGAAGTLAALSAVRTRDVSVEGRTESFTADTEAITPDGVEPAGSAQISIQVSIDEELVTRKLPGIVVRVAGEGVDPSRWSVAPGQVEVSLTGTVLSIEKAKAALAPMVRLSANDTKAREAAVIIEGLPPGIGVRISPERVKVTPIPVVRPVAPSP